MHAVDYAKITAKVICTTLMSQLHFFVYFFRSSVYSRFKLWPGRACCIN